MLSIFLQGFLLQASLILALGAQNIFVLNSGLMKRSHLWVAFISTICDTLLIFVGVLGVATMFLQFPVLKIGLGIIGVLFLFYYGVLKLKEARKDQILEIAALERTSLKKTILSTMAFSLLNPHVYLDTVVLIGGYSAKFNLSSERFLFGLGASSFSAIWFYTLSLLASFGSRFLKSSNSMKVISNISGIILILLSLKLGSDVFLWLEEFLKQ